MLFLKLSLLALMPLFTSIAMYLVDKKTKFSKISNVNKQIIFGVIFGLLAISSTELGQILQIKVNGGAILNSRDASVLIAGLVFGAPSGLIAGFMGGIHRYFAVYWGAGTYTQIACSVSTILAGIIGAGLRLALFDNKKPSVFYALIIGFVTEVIHMLMVFFTNMNDVEKAFSVVEQVSVPMVLINGVAVMLSVLVITLIGKEKVVLSFHNSKSIAILFQRWLLITVLIAYVLTSAFTIDMQVKSSKISTEKLLTLNIEDVKKDVLDASNDKILDIASQVKKYLEDEVGTIAQATNEEQFGISEINIINFDTGIIEETTDTENGFLGYDMNREECEQSKDFFDNLKAQGKYVQKYGQISSDSSIWRKYAGVILEKGEYSGKLMQIGYDAEGFQQFVDPFIIRAVQNRHVGNDGFLMVINSSDKIVASGVREYQGVVLTEEDVNLIKSHKNGTVVLNNHLIDNVPYYTMFEETESYYIISLVTKHEANLSRNLTIYITIFMEIILFACMFILIYLLVKKLVVNNIKKVNDSLSKITGGNLDVVVDVRSNEEFECLSDDINATVDTLKRYIADAAARIDRELELAKVIQESSLPSVFPPFPERKDFDIYASMNAAKEVGGDFYDFYLLDDNHLAFLVADVSGKGITGAMFMMKAKTVIKSLAEKFDDVAEILTRTNNALCDGNDAEMFVTCFMGIIDFKNGKIEFANAGHNPPLICKKDGKFEYFKSRSGFILGGMENIKYRKGEISFEQGDSIFLYTDGVTEATDVNNQLYGEERLKEALNGCSKNTANEICHMVREDVDKFVGQAPQFDDITTLCIKLSETKEIKDGNNND